MNTTETPQNYVEEVFSTLPIEGAIPAPVAEDIALEVEVQPPRNWNTWKPLGIGVSIVLGVSIVGVLVWKFLSYAPFVLPSAIALGHILLKDWHNYKPSWKRWPILGIVLAAGVGGIAYQSHQLQEKATTEAANRANTERLQGKVDATLAAQKNNTEVFTKSFAALSGELGDLKTKVTSEALQTKIAGLESKLENTQKALNPPKAEMLFSFTPVVNPPLKGDTIIIPIRDVTLPANPDGSVSVQFTMINNTDVDVIDGELSLEICSACKFAKEPESFIKVAGSPDTTRNFMLRPGVLIVADQTLE